MIALLPLDDRPCNRRFPVEVARIGHDDVLIPPLESLGRFNEPGHAEELALWLNGLPEVETLIVSVDMLAYGGLVASRRPSVDKETALARLAVLRAWKRSRPGTRVLAFNVLMRLAITMDSDAAIPHYYNIMRWARLADEATRFSSDYLKEQLQGVEAQIPPQILEEYRGARARNHAVNCAMVDWLADGTFDYLLITQEDCTEYGLHRLEQDAIMAKVQELGVTARFRLHPGADEAALTLLGRSWDTKVTFLVVPGDAEAMDRIAPFEDIPYGKALASHIEAVGGVLAGQMPVEELASSGWGGNFAPQADFLLFVNAPAGNTQKDETEEKRAQRKPVVSAFADAIAGALEAGHQVAVCDVAFPNGADDLLMRELERRNVLGRLAVFAGWNTAGNTTGTVLGQCAALKRTQDAGTAQLNRNFVFDRCLDDWCYQTLVRHRADKFARERSLSPLSMGAEAGPVEAMVRLELTNMAHMLAARQFGSRLDRLDVHLPWNRTFEVELGARLSSVD